MDTEITDVTTEADRFNGMQRRALRAEADLARIVALITEDTNVPIEGGGSDPVSLVHLVMRHRARHIASLLRFESMGAVAVIADPLRNECIRLRNLVHTYAGEIEREWGGSVCAQGMREESNKKVHLFIKGA